MKTTRLRLSVLLLLGGLWGPAALHAQGPESGQRPPGTPRTFMNKTTFHLPVLIDNQARASLRELQLFAKEGPDQPWVLKDKALPTQKMFTYRAPQDGEYWFTVVSIDQQGRAIPADVNREEPGLIVVLDTKAPTLALHLQPAAPEGMVIQCDIRDEHLDAYKKRVEYQTADKNWRVLEAMPGRPDHYCIPRQAMFTGLVRLSGVDLAGNTAIREFNVAALEQPAGATTTVPPAPVVHEEVRQVKHAAGETAGPILPVGGIEPPAPPPPAPIPVPVPVPAVKGKGIPLQPEVSEPQVTSKFPPQHVIDKQGPRPTGPAAARQIINGTHAVLKYHVDKIGPSGVGKVEIWVTADEGQSWKCLGEDADRQSPAEIDLPGEGLFGVTLAVSNGRGFGGTPPAKGDQPDLWIEVDRTAPTGELLDVRLETGREAGAMLISWRAEDKNLGPAPIELYYAAKKDGPWLPIVKGHKNDGHYRWQLPNDVAAEAYIRLVVSDLAGNRCRCETPQPILLDDHSRPRAIVINVKTEK